VPGAPVPRACHCSRRFVGRVLERQAYGDHVGFLLAPIDVEVDHEGRGLSYEQVEDVDPGHPA
jgi:hypothetical protein